MTDEMGSNRRRKRSSGRVEWNTPQVVIDAVCRVAPGGIALDPCWNARSLVQPRHTIDLERGGDGLALDWSFCGGLVYVNPPYGAALSAGTGKRPGKKKGWALKMMAEARAGTEIVALVPNSTETAWFRELFDACNAAVCWRGRLTFDGATTPAFFGSTLFYFGHRPYAFADAFSQHAYVIKMAPKGLAA
jgi:hypothetical protein